jgi:NAD(P)H-flavin reductase
MLTPIPGDVIERFNVRFLQSVLKNIDRTENSGGSVAQIRSVVKFQLSSNIVTLLEMPMKCEIGKCGRCNVGEKCVCKDGPVF